MEQNKKTSLLNSLVLVVVVVIGDIAAAAGTGNETMPKVPAVYIFGDSIFDTGNNNHIKTIVKCNFPPYGLDFPGRMPTGRFSNGKVPSDFLVSGLGIKEYLPPYIGVNLSPEDLRTGVCFASGASGFDPLTPKVASVISMTDQLKLFEGYKKKLRAVTGMEEAESIVTNSLYIIGCGSDDLLNTYFITPFRKLHYDIPSYVNLLVSSASNFLMKLNESGAKKIGFLGLPPIGCLPLQRTFAGGIERDCDPKRNHAAELFNSKMEKELDRLSNGPLKGSTTLVFLDIFSSLLDIIQRPSVYGFDVSTKGCCGTGKLEVSVLCNGVTSKVCEDDSKYVFWDSYHPTERTYQILVDDLLRRYLSRLT